MPRGLGERDLCDITSPKEMADILTIAEPDNPAADVARRRHLAVKANNFKDVEFWDDVSTLLNGKSKSLNQKVKYQYFQ